MFKYPLVYILGALTAAAIGVSAFTDSSTVPPVQAPPAVHITLPAPPTPAQAVQGSQMLSNDNHYINVDNNSIHSPSWTPDNSIPAGASAHCRDGSYSFSTHRSGTCSHHGGVARWL